MFGSYAGVSTENQRIHLQEADKRSFDRQVKNNKSPVPAKSLSILQQYPPAELYRLIVDGRFHRNQQGWTGYENREKGSLKAVFNGLTFAITNLENKTLTKDYVKQLHKTCTTNVENMMSNKPGVFHEAPVRIGLQSYQTTRDGLLKIIKMMRSGDTAYLSSYQIFQFSICRNNLDQIIQDWNLKNDEELADQLFLKLNLSSEFFYLPPDASVVNEQLNLLCEKYNKEIIRTENDDEKLNIIISYIHGVEHLHPFNDGNTRTFTISLLLRLLLQNGFMPATHFDPNYVEGFSVKEFCSEVRLAMLVTKDIVNGSKETFGFSTKNMPEEKQNELFKMTVQFVETIKSEFSRLESEGLLTSQEEYKSGEQIKKYWQLAEELDNISINERLNFANCHFKNITDAALVLVILQKLDRRDKLSFFKEHVELLKNGRQLFRALEIFPEIDRYELAIHYVKCENITDLISIVKFLPVNLRLPYIFYNEEKIKYLTHFGKVLDNLPKDGAKKELEQTLFPFIRHREYPGNEYPLKEKHYSAYQHLKNKLDIQYPNFLLNNNEEVLAIPMNDYGNKLCSGVVRLWSFKPEISGLNETEEVRSNNVYRR